MANIKNNNTNCWQGYEESGIIIILGDNIKQYIHSGKKYSRFSNTKHVFTI